MKIIIPVMLLLSLSGFADYHHKEIKAACGGDKICKACKNCKYCKHCAKGGGTCGTCKKK